MTTATGSALPPPGPNRPCPCGSSKKYKNCCRSTDELRGRGVAALFDREDARAQATLDWALERLGPSWHSAAFALADQRLGQASRFTLACALHVVPFQGKPASTSYEEAHPHLPPIERELLASLRAAWTSVWEVREEAKASALLLDRLTGEERRVTLGPAQDWLEVGDLLLARVCSLAGESFLHAADLDELPSKEANTVLGLLRERLGREPPIDPERLRAPESTATLITAWRELCSAYQHRRDAEEERLEARPYLSDRFSFAPGDRGAIEQRALALPGAKEQLRDDFELDVVVMDAAHAAADEGDGELGAVLVRDGELILETRSPAQADQLRKLVEAHCGEAIRFIERKAES